MLHPHRPVEATTAPHRSAPAQRTPGHAASNSPLPQAYRPVSSLPIGRRQLARRRRQLDCHPGDPHNPLGRPGLATGGYAPELAKGEVETVLRAKSRPNRWPSSWTSLRRGDCIRATARKARTPPGRQDTAAYRDKPRPVPTQCATTGNADHRRASRNPLRIRGLPRSPTRPGFLASRTP